MSSSEVRADMESANPRLFSRHVTGVQPRDSYPPGAGFATGRISLGDLDVIQVSTFEETWSAQKGGPGDKGVTFYKPVQVPAGYTVLSHYAQENARPRAGWVLAAKPSASTPSPPSLPSPSSSPSPSPPSSPSSLNPFATLSRKSHNVEEHLSSREGASAGDEEIIYPFSKVSMVEEEQVGPVRATTESDTGAAEEAKTKALLGSVTAPASPALTAPSGFRLIWRSGTWGGPQSGEAWVWMPVAPEGYLALGYVITDTDVKPSTSEVGCVRADLTDTVATDTELFSTDTPEFALPFTVWSTRPAVRGVAAPGVHIGSFACARSANPENPLPIACLKNVAMTLDAMPTMAQVEAAQRFFGPTLVFHPSEEFLPSSVAWFFESGARLYSRDGSSPPTPIKSDGSNLPQGGTNDGAFWIDLPEDHAEVKKGMLETAHVHIHVKPVYGATFTDLQSWVFYPFNGPSTARVGRLNIPLGRVGEHVGDWEHYTLRISNFTGEMEAVYFSQHSKGHWVKLWDLEFDDANRPRVYVAKSGHPCYAHQGDHLQGDERRGIGLRNDTALSKILLPSSAKFQVFSAKYMHQRGDTDAPEEPEWLHYMREWGPKIEYDRTKYLDKFLRLLPSKVRGALEEILDSLPSEVMGQEGPTGPSEKNMWNGDERS